MKYLILFLFIFLWNCSQPGDGGKDFLPDAPQMVVKTAAADTTRLENGIDAVHGDVNAIQIMWHSHPQANDLDEFRVYKSTENGQVNYKHIGTIPLENVFVQDTTFIDNNAVIGQKSFYFVTAVSKDNLESAPSDTVWYTLLDKAMSLRMDINLNPPSIVFNFQIPTNATPSYYIIRVEEASLDESSYDLVLVILTDQDIYGDGDVSYTFQGNDVQKIFQENRPYQWRIDLVEGDQRYAGSESAWQHIENIDWTN